MRNEDPSLRHLSPLQHWQPMRTIMHISVMVFSPIQWAHGYDPDSKDDAHDPFWVNEGKFFGSETFAQFQKHRDLAMKLNEEERAKNMMTRLYNSAPRDFLHLA